MLGRIALLWLPLLALGVKFDLPASHSPAQKCLWNYAMSDTLVVISVSAPLTPGDTKMRVDMEIVDGSGSRNIYQAKKGIKGETRMAITTHADADLGVCFKNVLDEGALILDRFPFPTQRPFQGFPLINLTSTFAPSTSTSTLAPTPSTTTPSPSRSPSLVSKSK